MIVQPLPVLAGAAAFLSCSHQEGCTGSSSATLEVCSPGDMQSPDYECGIWVPVCQPEEETEQEAAEPISTRMTTGVLS